MVRCAICAVVGQHLVGALTVRFRHTRSTLISMTVSKVTLVARSGKALEEILPPSKPDNEEKLAAVVVPTVGLLLDNAA